MYGSRRHSQHVAMQSVQIQALHQEIGRILDVEIDLGKLKRQLDVRFMDMGRMSSDRMEKLRAEIDRRIETEIERNVDRLKYEIDSKLAEARTLGKKQFDKLHDQIQQDLSTEIARSSLPVYARRNDDAKVKVEVLKRLYDEFMNNKV